MKAEPTKINAAVEAGEPIALIDVRTPAEFREAHIPRSQLMTLDRIDAAAVKSAVPEGGKGILICRSGKRAADAYQKLTASGCGHLEVLDGGVTAWENAGLPLNRGEPAISLERQVRIAAGLLVLCGVILGSTVHPGFYGLSAFVGAGLVFAGITDWCGMGLLLAKMPWNQR